MARLNDYTAPAESIEALKRRFVRQNREIARVNSMQSLRIRSLESEVSHLLAENVSLRQEVINLTQETERLAAAKTLHSGIYDIKSRLDTKLAELNDLASELGMLPRKATKLDKPDHERPKVAEARPQPMDLENGVDDGRLPAILEDKYYPRRTFETQEIQNLVRSDSTPEQPVLHLELSEKSPGIDSPTPSPKKHEPLSNIPLEEPASPDPFLPPTLETRKKKKKADPTIPTNEANTLLSGETKRPTKSGSKRKFSPDEDGALSDVVSESDEFQFSRHIQSPQKSTTLDLGLEDRALSPIKAPVSIRRGSAAGTMKRKVLEPKSANLNLNSPKKARASLHPDKKISQSRCDENTVSPQKSKMVEKPERSLSQAARRPRTVDAQTEKHSQLSVDQPILVLPKDSPIVQTTSIDSSDDASTSRSSRRRGAVVSYAEPNLRAKMRRPTEGFIDAVGKNGSRRSSSFQLDSGDADNGERPTHSPCPARNEIDDSTSNPMNTSRVDGYQLSETVSRRRQSRRHSSNPKSTREPSQRLSETVSLKKQSPATSSSFIQTDSSFEADDSPDWKNSESYRRETRVAARRRSMMV
ncbi:uncharacterized protein N7483_011453 [Penicillium malachiteum]|uniref:uncharacterized protein n=1 Tax=Penicillium malachiteum TaxID=1324776 RepID=UPI0025499A29|nr:uncharacterized protein N7483_011453 [Penicillium malachiteum]KAJ5714272.1 hypothetical protein N7483_011453 [Penicillium malachiteum]